mmetsp:Transcript_26600/g.45275  ORF Transcript_26600/g.45275 Transcript_26600/m.45275 type:complete len:157 (-) Transcript_26600:1297-1767(-)|eukprot:scaffold44180_cov219-Skeletonema_marinoi.AAC.3
MKAEASTSALYTSKSSKGPTAKSSKAHLGCEMMVGVHLGDSYHDISCDINAVTTCAEDSLPGSCCYEATMGWGDTTGIKLAAMLAPDFTTKRTVLAVQGFSVDRTIAGAITLPASMKILRASDIMYNFASTKKEAEEAYPTYQTTAYGVFDVMIMK